MFGMLSENFDVFFADFGVLVQHGSNTCKATLDMPSEIIAGGMVLSTDYQLTFKTDSLPGLAHADLITVDGASYKVRDVRLKDDGKISEAYLSLQ